jgi:hypothetical protein
LLTEAVMIYQDGDTPFTHLIRVSFYVLAKRSRFFRQVLLGPMREADTSVCLLRVAQRPSRKALDFMFKDLMAVNGVLGTLTPELAREILPLADMWGVTHMFGNERAMIALAKTPLKERLDICMKYRFRLTARFKRVLADAFLEDLTCACGTSAAKMVLNHVRNSDTRASAMMLWLVRQKDAPQLCRTWILPPTSDNYRVRIFPAFLEAFPVLATLRKQHGPQQESESSVLASKSTPKPRLWRNGIPLRITRENQQYRLRVGDPLFPVDVIVNALEERIRIVGDVQLTRAQSNARIYQSAANFWPTCGMCNMPGLVPHDRCRCHDSCVRTVCTSVHFAISEYVHVVLPSAKCVVLLCATSAMKHTDTGRLAFPLSHITNNCLADVHGGEL